MDFTPKLKKRLLVPLSSWRLFYVLIYLPW